MAKKKPIRRAMKQAMPTQLFARAMLILLLPMVILQLATAYLFYERHWDSVVRNMSAATAADIALLVEEYRRESAISDHAAAVEHVARLGKRLNMDVSFRHGRVQDGAGSRQFADLYEGVKSRLDMSLEIEQMRQENLIRATLQMHDGALEIVLSKKRLASSTTYIFLLWMVGSSLLLMLIATLFLRNQIKPIVQLARVAEQFGLGHDVQNFSPRGASEIRRAGNAFLVMADRVRRNVQSRTEMLAGISHDLRTPLTRMKLEMEMGKIDAATKDALSADVDEMRRMIDEYLDFARGDAGEEMVTTDISALVADVVEGFQRGNKPVQLRDDAGETFMMLRPQAIRRAVTNLIENALRYGKEADVLLEVSATFVRIKVSDLGPGIPEAEHETVFKPFTRLEASRNLDTGGVGLGLSIARDIAMSHGGYIMLENQRDAQGAITGLEATLRLPRQTK